MKLQLQEIFERELGYSITAKLRWGTLFEDALKARFPAVELPRGGLDMPVAPLALGFSAIFESPEQAQPFAENILSILGTIMPDQTLTLKTVTWPIGAALSGLSKGNCLTTPRIARELRKILAGVSLALVKNLYQEDDPENLGFVRIWMSASMQNLLDKLLIRSAAQLNGQVSPNPSPIPAEIQGRDVSTFRHNNWLPEPLIAIGPMERFVASTQSYSILVE